MGLVPTRRMIAPILSMLIAFSGAGAARAEVGSDTAAAEAVLAAVVRINATVPGDSQSAEYLGTERDGSGVVIDGNGLVLTIGYLIVEAQGITLTLADGRKVPADVVGYDQASGFGLIRALQPLHVKPLELGSSARLEPSDRAVVASWGGPPMAMPVVVVSRRTFAGYWEYMLERAIFTAPPHPAFGGAALLSPDGKLLGIGSLVVPDAPGPTEPMAGNMFVPIDRLKPILADLLERGRAGPKRPWIGLNSEEVHGRLFVNRVNEGGPAERAGIEAGDLVLGVEGEAVTNLEEFYRKLWSHGEAGATVVIDVLKGVNVAHIPVKTIDRYDMLKLSRSY